MKDREKKGFFEKTVLSLSNNVIITNTNNNSVASVRGRTISTELPPLVGEVSANSIG
jgi:hypothetical protein